MAWDFIAVSTYAETAETGGNITLNAPTGAAQGDLLIACIAYRSNAAFTPNDSSWNLVATQQSSGDTDSTQGIASGVMYYCIRGASNPGFQFNRTGGNVAQGTVLCYRGNASSSVYDTGNAATRDSVGEPTLTEITTAAANELIIAMISHGDNTLTSAVDAATNPSTASGGTDTTTDPTADTWIERFDRGSNTGADTGLIVADGLKSTAGATGAFSATAATNQSRSVFIVGAFKIAPQTRLFPMASTGESVAAAAAAMSVVRTMAPVSTGESVTPNSILGLIFSFPTAVIGESVTASAAVLSNVRAFPWVSTGESLTADAAMLSILITYLIVSAGESLTADAAVLDLLRTFPLVSTGEASTASAALSIIDYIQLQLSDYIAASAADPTTARLTAPGEKSFQAGKISDDTNPLPSIDLDANKYTELEWCLFVSSAVGVGDQYEFRVTTEGTLLDIYGQTPKISIGNTYIFPYQSAGESAVSVDSALNIVRNLAWLSSGESETALSALALQCTFSHSVIGESLTSDPILSTIRSMQHNVIGESITADSSIIVVRPFLYQSFGESLTSNSVLNVLRLCSWNAVGESLTAASSLLNLLSQILSSSGESLTGTAALSVVRALAWSVIGESLTATADLTVSGAVLLFLLGVIGESLLADSGMSLVRTFTHSSTGESDVVDPILSVLRRKLLAVEGESVLPGSTLNLIRAFVNASTGESLTADAAVLAVLRTIPMACIGESFTADPLMNLLRSIAWSVFGESLTATADLTVEEGLLRLFLLGVIGESLVSSPIINVVRLSTLLSVGESNTAGSTLSILRLLLQSVTGESILTDSNLSLVRAFALTPIGESVTATPAMALLRRFILGTTGEAQITGATLAVLRTLVWSAIGESLLSSPSLHPKILGIINNPSLLLTTLKRCVAETGLLEHSILKLSDPSAVVQEAVQTLYKINERRITTLTPVKVVDLVTAQKVIQGDSDG